MSDPQFTHLDSAGHARMVDVSPKEPTLRRAVARCDVLMEPETIAAIVSREVKKGDVLSVARVAGIQAAKRTSDMIPLCHPLMISSVSVNLAACEVRITATARCAGATGVEMEALTAAGVAALTVYDMCKAASKGIVIREVRLLEKTGGKSGTWRAPPGCGVESA